MLSPSRIPHLCPTDRAAGTFPGRPAHGEWVKHPGTPDYPRFWLDLAVSVLQDAWTRYFCLFRTGRARLRGRAIMMYSSRDPVSQPT
ncbi:hypothetical protein VTI28DRAFT_8748 [Corynascus sepedonium]